MLARYVGDHAMSGQAGVRGRSVEKLKAVNAIVNGLCLCCARRRRSEKIHKVNLNGGELHRIAQSEPPTFQCQDANSTSEYMTINARAIPPQYQPAGNAGTVPLQAARVAAPTYEARKAA